LVKTKDKKYCSLQKRIFIESGINNGDTSFAFSCKPAAGKYILQKVPAAAVTFLTNKSSARRQSMTRLPQIRLLQIDVLRLCLPAIADRFNVP
jgi:hypothetical protein